MLSKYRPCRSLTIAVSTALAVVLSAGQALAHAGHYHVEFRSENDRAAVHQVEVLTTDRSFATGGVIEALASQTELHTKKSRDRIPPSLSIETQDAAKLSTNAEPKFFLTSGSMISQRSCDGNCCNCPGGCCASLGCRTGCGPSSAGCWSAGNALISPESTALSPLLASAWFALVNTVHRDMSIAPELPPPRA